MLPTAIRPKDSRNNVAEMTGEYESARLYLARWAAQNIMRQQKEEQNDKISDLTDKKAGTSKANNGDVRSVWEEWLNEQGDLGPFEVISVSKDHIF